ncbi:DUF333 domain-containing protein, partial [Candidatus Woesearchaeota archaeon]|nr:DUF333 domain-containing protein [Candidatus Woesearchaeota archaeon]
MRKGVVIAVSTVFFILLCVSVFAASNPSAVYCEQLGHQYTTKKSPDGSESGICMVDGEECDSWDFYKGTCAPDASACAVHGYMTTPSSGSADPYSAEYALCEPADQITGFATAVKDGPSWVMRLMYWLTSHLLTGHAIAAPPGTGQLTVSGLVDIEASTCDDTPDSAPPGIPDASGEDGGDDGPPAAPPGAPAEFDWRNYNGENWITPVKNQGSCGSCWSFSAAANMEANYNIDNNNPDLDPDLSEDYLVSDCHSYLGYQTCCGGWHAIALEYARTSGFPDESCLPYSESCSCSTSCSLTCTYNSGNDCSDRTCSDRCADYSSRLWTIDTGTWYSSRTDAELKQMVYDEGPLSVSLGIGSSYGGYFDGDIYRCTDDSGTNHAVLLVGYNDSGSYWVIKNSWGSTWNGDGYYKLGYGECGLQSISVIGTVSASHPDITLNSPADSASSSDDPVIFNFSVNLQVASTATCQLIIDGEVNKTNTSVADTTDTIFETTIGDGTYAWNITCWENGNGAVDYSPTRTISVDTSPPTVSIMDPQERTYTSSAVPLNYVAYDFSGVHSCWVTNTTGQNQSMPDCQNTTMTVSDEGNHTIILYANDTLGHLASEAQNFTVDLEPPNVTFYTPPNETVTKNVTITVAVNVSDAVSSIAGCILEWNHSSNNSMSVSCSEGRGICQIDQDVIGS